MNDMNRVRSFVPSDEAVMVLGGLNAKRQDRSLERGAVKPVQLLIDGEIKPVPFFNSWGVLGVSSLAWHPRNSLTLYVSTGAELTKVDLESRRVAELGVSNLRDVHEMTVIGDVLWIANTGLNEVIAFDVAQERVLKRMSLTVVGSDPKITVDVTKIGNGAAEVADGFHCNQVFGGFDGELYALVHHVSGKQLIRHMAGKFIKSQGNGGVIDLITGDAVPLGLKGPHSVQKVRESYWVFDSGRSMINIYDPTWVLRETLPTKGWGRGADVSEPSGLFYGGVSETRKRYVNLTPRTRRAPNMVQVFSIESRAPISGTKLADIEQVNNVYVVSRETACALLDLSVVSSPIEG
jgi:hypothetical protein